MAPRVTRSIQDIIKHFVEDRSLWEDALEKMRSKGMQVTIPGFRIGSEMHINPGTGIFVRAD